MEHKAHYCFHKRPPQEPILSHSKLDIQHISRDKNLGNYDAETAHSSICMVQPCL